MSTTARSQQPGRAVNYARLDAPDTQRNLNSSLDREVLRLVILSLLAALGFLVPAFCIFVIRHLS